jgi:hypothetical protein
MQKELPFDLLGIDSDNGSRLRYHNGSEFILAHLPREVCGVRASAGVNDLLYRYCLDKKITFTRSRPYKNVAKTPYQRVMVGQSPTIMEREDVSLDRKAHLLPALAQVQVNLYLQLNPVALRNSIACTCAGTSRPTMVAEGATTMENHIMVAQSATIMTNKFMVAYLATTLVAEVKLPLSLFGLPAGQEERADPAV